MGGKERGIYKNYIYLGTRKLSITPDIDHARQRIERTQRTR